MPIEPFDAQTASRAKRAEPQSAHEWCIQYRAGYQGDDEADAHYAEKKHPGQAKKHVRMQLQQKVEQRIDRRRPQRFACNAIEKLEMHVTACRIRRRTGRNGQQRAVLTERHEQRDFTRTFRQGAVQHRIQR